MVIERTKKTKFMKETQRKIPRTSLIERVKQPVETGLKLADRIKTLGE